MSRLRAADLLVLASALGLLATLFLDWFSVDRDGIPTPDGWNSYVPLDLALSGWSSLGWLLVALLCLLVLLGIVVVALLALGVADLRNLPVAVVLCALAPPILVAALIRVLLAQPGLGAGLPNDAVGVAAGGWLGLAATTLLAFAAWASLGADRTTLPKRASLPPAARPAPPAT